MSPGAYATNIWSHRPHDPHGGVVWATIIAIVFFALATASFALDQIIMLCLR
jgi:hypothetical protein